MLKINDLIFRIEGRLLFDAATATLPTGHKAGLVGRNGSGKTTLLKLITGELSPDDGAVSVGRNESVGIVAQEAPGGPESLIDWVLAADKERAALLAEAEHASDPDRIAEIQLRLTDIDAYSAPSRAATILSGLGFDEAAQSRPCAEYSGGWRMRVALAAALFAAPDILLLDEPTNYLDLEGTLWLEGFIAKYPRTILIVSHDRDLLNRAVSHILHLDRGKLTLWAGGYDDFERQRRERQRLDLKMKAKQDDARRHMEAFVERFRYKASKARQAQSRLKVLEKMQPIVEMIDERVPPFLFPNPAKQLGNPLLRFENAVAAYADNPPVLENITLRIDEDDRIGLLGANGNGKSTFAKLLCGRLAPRDGVRRCSKKIMFGYFAQHQLDELNPEASPYDNIAALMPDATEARKRAKLGALGFGIEKVDTKSRNLSGGEKARLLFALATFHGPHVLILDEPTNHLDVDSREALILALNDYQGAVILISHDRHLIEATADRLWIVRGGSVTPYEGDLETYRAECLAERSGKSDARGKRRQQRRGEQAEANPTADRDGDRRKSAQRRQDLAPMKKRISEHERRMADLSSKIARLDARLGDAGLYATNPEKAAAYAQKRAELAKRLEDAEHEWLTATEAYEAAAG